MEPMKADGMTLASQSEHDRWAGLAARLGFTDAFVQEYEDGTRTVIHAFWRGAPVAMSLRSGLAGGFSVAFHRGDLALPYEDEDGNERFDSWDEVADTQTSSPDIALLLGAALLTEFDDDRSTLYAGQPRPHGID